MDSQLASNLEKMLMDGRGYVEVDDGKPSGEFHEKLFVAPSGKIAMTVVLTSMVGLKKYSKYIEGDSYEVVIVIYFGSVTLYHRALEKTLKHKIEIWSSEQLLVNPTTHVLCPKIEVVPKLSCQYQIPKISFYDPLMRYFRIKPKTILKVTNVDGWVSFRRVV
ncbi:hypothetical protein AV955_gp010 [Diadromus pulchellus ascovirus 4a]|uniref:Complete DpAV4 genome n=1 Tax=Diadromus pulchellus ascovirus 4a TaxID=158683 RepID=F2NYT9_9VIRU|nr:hypothetical protein AV955_gp010 [Diadromus pulchellus ascovirus 4a]CCA61367.1 unnamed protein product [Diadromus pulchellus ascovirus 4a]